MFDMGGNDITPLMRAIVQGEKLCSVMITKNYFSISTQDEDGKLQRFKAFSFQ